MTIGQIGQIITQKQDPVHFINRIGQRQRALLYLHILEVWLLHRKSQASCMGKQLETSHFDVTYQAPHSQHAQ